MKNFSGGCQAAGADKPLRAFFIWITNIVTLSAKTVGEEPPYTSTLSAKTVGEEPPYTSTHLHTALFLWPKRGRIWGTIGARQKIVSTVLAGFRNQACPPQRAVPEARGVWGCAPVDTDAAVRIAKTKEQRKLAALVLAVRTIPHLTKK